MHTSDASKQAAAVQSNRPMTEYTVVENRRGIEIWSYPQSHPAYGHQAAYTVQTEGDDGIITADMGGRCVRVGKVSGGPSPSLRIGQLGAGDDNVIKGILSPSGMEIGENTFQWKEGGGTLELSMLQPVQLYPFYDLYWVVVASAQYEWPAQQPGSSMRGSARVFQKLWMCGSLNLEARLAFIAAFWLRGYAGRRTSSASR